MQEMLDIKYLKFFDKNPRTISKEDLKKCMDSLQDDPDFLEHRPILVNYADGEYTVYGGHQRIRAAQKLGWLRINCSVSKDLTEDQMRQRMIKDNAHYGEFDWDALANDFDMDDLIAAGLDEGDLQLEMDDEVKPKKEKKAKFCPHCNEEI